MYAVCVHQILPLKSYLLLTVTAPFHHRIHAHTMSHHATDLKQLRRIDRSSVVTAEIYVASVRPMQCISSAGSDAQMSFHSIVIIIQAARAWLRSCKKKFLLILVKNAQKPSSSAAR